VNRRGGLGRGLAALIPPGEEERGATLIELPPEAVVPNPRQPRDVFDEDELEGLATSIRDMGLLQPIVVRPLDEGRYELIAGERRLRAARLAGLELLPALVRHTDDGDLLKEALVENIHRVRWRRPPRTSSCWRSSTSPRRSSRRSSGAPAPPSATRCACWACPRRSSAVSRPGS
jgi:hypothetical protein